MEPIIIPDPRVPVPVPPPPARVIQVSMEELTGGINGAIKRFDPLEGARAKALPHTSQNALMERRDDTTSTFADRGLSRDPGLPESPRQASPTRCHPGPR